MTREDAAALLSCSKDCVDDLIARGKLEAVETRQQTRWRQDAQHRARCRDGRWMLKPWPYKTRAPRTAIRPEPPTEAKIRFLLENDDTLTGWEYEFLYGVRDLPALSEKQTAVRRARR